jgi:hypothetical protein
MSTTSDIYFWSYCIVRQRYFLNHETRVYNVENDVAGMMCAALYGGWAAVGAVRAAAGGVGRPRRVGHARQGHDKYCIPLHFALSYKTPLYSSTRTRPALCSDELSPRVCTSNEPFTLTVSHTDTCDLRPCQ